MKLATYKDGTRDGQLVVVSRDLGVAHYASGIASRLQQVLDDWAFLAPQLQDLSTQLNAGRAPHSFAFDPAQCMAPLPRAYQWISGAACPHHLERAQQLRPGAASPGLDGSLLLQQGASDDFLGPCDDIVVQSEALGIDFAAEVAVITGDVPRGATPEQALARVRLVLLANAVGLHHLVRAERDRGCGLFQSRPATAFSPVAVTFDELGEAWSQGRLHLGLQTSWNGRKVGLGEVGPAMACHFGQLIAQAARTRQLRAGTVLGSGTVSHPGVPDAKGRLQWPQGYHSVADKRCMESLQDGQPSTPFMAYGDTVRIEMKGKDGGSVFGAIDQAVAEVAELE